MGAIGPLDQPRGDAPHRGAQPPGAPSACGEQAGHHEHRGNLLGGSGHRGGRGLKGRSLRDQGRLRGRSRHRGLGGRTRHSGSLWGRSRTGAEALHGGGERPGHLLAASGLVSLGLQVASELAFQFDDAGLGGMVIALEGAAQLGGDALQGADATLQASAALVDRGEPGGERGPALLGDLRGDMGLLGAALEAVELGAVAAAQANRGLLGLDPQLLLSVLALLDAAQLALALSELGDGALALALDLHLATAQVGEVGLQGTYRGFRRLGAAEVSLIDEPGAACAALGEQIASALQRRANARDVISLGNHRAQSMGAVGRLSATCPR